MSHTKKIIALLCAAMLVFALIGCVNGEDDGGDTATPEIPEIAAPSATPPPVDISSVGIIPDDLNVPDAVLTAALDRVRHDFEFAPDFLIENGAEFDNWRLEYIEHAYTYDDMNIEIYRFDWRLHTTTPEDRILLAGGMYLDADGWLCTSYPDSHYLVFSDDGGELVYLFTMMENDCQPGDETFTSDLLNRLNSDVSPPLPPEIPVDPTPPEAPHGDPSILIAYFTQAENLGADATTSASVDAGGMGNAGYIAELIRERTNGDVFSIRTAEPYPAGNDIYAIATNELSANARPELSGAVSNFADYDIVFIGFPIWNSTCPRAVLSFVEQHDFSGKTVVLFGSFGRGSLGTSVGDITAALPGDCTVLDSFGISLANLPGAESLVASWLTELGY